MQLLALSTLEAVVEAAVEVVERSPAQQAAQASSSLPTHNSSHLWHLSMQV
jgi:hypothetical protein